MTCSISLPKSERRSRRPESHRDGGSGVGYQDMIETSSGLQVGSLEWLMMIRWPQGRRGYQFFAR